jgi:predicted HicB family RNase H-like nuclease
LIHQEDDEPLPPGTAGREHSGKFVLRAGKELHKKLANGALLADKSLNSYCVQVLEQSGKSKQRKSG